MENPEHSPASRGLVSVGFMTHNRAGTFLREALESLLAQTYKNFEIIISDDASTDDTEKICKEYAAQDKRIRYIRQERNIGFVYNPDFVVSQARGEYFLWACDDDRWDPGFLEKCVDKFREDPEAIMVFTRFNDVFLDGSFVKTYDPKKFFPFERDLFGRLRSYTLFYANDLKSVLQYGLWRLQAMKDIAMSGPQGLPRHDGWWGFNILFIYRALAKGPFAFVDETLFFRRTKVKEKKLKKRNFIARLFWSFKGRLEKIFNNPLFYLIIWFTLRIKKLSFGQRLYLALLNIYVMARLLFRRKI
ncbi:MAG: glycosyltransferase family 2 protein [Patescibacteria group bacterium]|nr:glycosyltransferase family 2 protein [Patescibacteria group bacterium]MDE2015256.1 glycosyltransferase family 2 protein [Patescibacteria group bacterium]MDE2227062.1 glycosyltransferase family 2 protein [Patescibacteria group bacterium]